MIANVIDFTVECIKLLIVLRGIINYRMARPYKALIAYSATALIIIVTFFINSDYISILMAMSIVVCSLAVKGKRRFLFGALAFLSICFTDELLMLLLKKYIPNITVAVDENAAAFCVVNALSILIFAPVALFMQNIIFTKMQNADDYMNSTGSVYLFLLIVGEFSALLFISPFSLINYHDSFRNNVLVLSGACVLGVLFTIIGILLLYNNNSKLHYKRLTEINSKRLEMQEEYYKMLLKKENETRRFRHDIANHLLCIDTLLKENDLDSAMEYLTQLRGSVSKMHPKIHSGNILIDSIVNDISGKYENVDLLWKGNLPDKLLISDIDICSIFSNLLENAFYAAGGLSEDGKVEVTIKILGSSVIYTIKNNISKPIKKVKNRLVSMKPDKQNHGFGMMNVRDSLEKYGGRLDYSYTDTEFSVDVIIPNAIKAPI